MAVASRSVLRPTVTGLRLARRPQARQEIDQGRHLVRADLLAVRRHVAAPGRAVADLVDELAGRQACADARQVRPAFPAAAFQGVTVAAVLVLEDHGPLELPRGAAAHDVLRDRLAAPGGHLRRPGRGRTLVGQGGEDRIDHDHSQDGHRPAAGSAFAAIGHERDEEQGKDQDDREHQDDKRFGPGGTERQQAEEPEKRPFGPGIGAAQSGIGRAGGALGSEQRGQDHNHDDRQGGEENILLHGLAQEGDAGFQLLFVLGVVGFRIDGLRRGRAAR